MTVQQALNLLQLRRPISEPNSGFVRQLELFEKENYVVNLRSNRVRQFLLGRTNAIDSYITPDMMMGNATVSDPYSDIVQEKPMESKPPLARLRCKMCRHELATEKDLVEHDLGRGELSFEPHKRDSVRKGLNAAPVARQRGTITLPPQLREALHARHQRLISPQCSAYFVEPLPWMSESSDLVEGVLSGRLICPNRSCSAKLGSWTWAGTQCAWYVTSYILLTSAELG